MAPLTRCRATPGTHVPTDLFTEYYAQRASAGLIITECTMILPLTSAFYSEPGIYTPEQISKWKEVTDAVHAKGGKIFIQLWHAGRAAHPAYNDGAGTIAPSAIAIEGEVHTPSGKVPHVTPREITIDEIPHVVSAFATAAKAAVEQAGFDGVEIHAANGYLIDQFLRDGANKRTDAYGGAIENRARFLCEVLTAVTAAIGSDKVGVRLSMLNSYNSMIDADPTALNAYLATRLNDFQLAFVHVMRADFFQAQQGDVLTPFRAAYKGVLVANMGYTKEEADAAIAAHQVDVVAFGKAFLANPDLPARFAKNADLNEPKPDLFYTSGPEGYTDYPALAS